jgi:hypothetical protein
VISKVTRDLQRVSKHFQCISLRRPRRNNCH